MKLFAFILTIILIATPLYAEEIIIPQKYLTPLYRYYLEDFTIKGAYYHYEILSSGGTTEINGVKISTIGKGDINIPLSEITKIPFWERPKIEHINTSTGKVEYTIPTSFNIGCFPIGSGYLNDATTYFKMKLEIWIQALRNKGYTEIYFHTKSKKPIKIRIKGNE